MSLILQLDPLKLRKISDCPPLKDEEPVILLDCTIVNELFQNNQRQLLDYDFEATIRRTAIGIPLNVQMSYLPQLWKTISKCDMNKETSKSKHKWKAEEYYNNSSVQRSAAEQLLQRLLMNGNESILDVGCGDGKITAEIAKRVSSGKIKGLDISPDMISFAQKKFPKEALPNLEFIVKDAQNLDYNSEFDLVFSSFALQWLSDLDSFLGSAYRSLQPNGCLAASVPLGISSALEESTAHLISLPEWAPFFQNFSPGWHFPKSDHFKELLIKNNFDINEFNIVDQEVIFTSREAFEKYVIQWFSYLRPLPEELKATFFKKVMDGYFQKVAPDEKGEVLFKFPRVDLIAYKLTL